MDALQSVTNYPPLAVAATFPSYALVVSCRHRSTAWKRTSLGFIIGSKSLSCKYSIGQKRSSRVRQSVCLSVCVCVCVFVRLRISPSFSVEDKASSVKFCTAVHGRPRQGIVHFGELCSPRSPKSEESASTPLLHYITLELFKVA